MEITDVFNCIAWKETATPGRHNLYNITRRLIRLPKMVRFSGIFRRVNAPQNAVAEHVISLESACCYDNIPLHSAVKENNAEKLEYLLGQRKVDLNYRDKVTALYLSLQLLRSDSFIIRLIEAGCDPNRRTVNNDTPLHIAINRLTTKVTLKLIEKGADLNALDGYNRTPLHYAVEKNNLESVCILLYYGANFNLKDLCSETPIEIALKYESLEIISALLGYYDSNALLLFLISQQRQLPSVTLKLIFYLIGAGANVNYLGLRVFNLVLHSIYESSDELFKLIWSRCDHTILLNREVAFLECYINHCKFPPKQWSECLHLILESPVADDLIKHAKMDFLYTADIKCFSKKSYPIITALVIALNKRKIENKDRVGLIYLFLSFKCRVNDDCFKLVYEVDGFQEELEALIYCSSTNVNICKYLLFSFNFPLACNCMEEPSMEEIFWWFKFSINMFLNDNDETVMKEIANTLGLFWLPVYMKEELLDLFNDGDNYRRDISKILNEGATFPSLTELSRNQTRRCIKENCKIEKAYQFYDVLKKLKLSQMIYDIICFKKPIYYISISQQLCADAVN